MAQGKRTSGGGMMGPETIAIFCAVGLAVAVILGLWISSALGAAFGSAKMPGDPFGHLFDVLDGDYKMTGLSIAFLVIFVLLLVGIGITVWARMTSSSGGGKKSRVDANAKFMAKTGQIGGLTKQGALSKAASLGVATAGPGVFIGRTVRGDVPVYGNWEDMHVDIWGPRTGKTTSRAIPAILDAPGAVVATSNKRDIVDGTRGPRSAKGQVWVFDPMDVAGEQPTWWWNPLSFIIDETHARDLAEQFVNSQRSENARTDAFFDAAGTDLLTNLLLAAAVGKYPITKVYSWIADPRDDEPERILRNTPGLELSADALAGVIHAPDKQRAGVYGTAQASAQFLVNRDVVKWIVPNGPNDTRPHFNPYEFVRGHNTLYSLSREGSASAGPVVAALTVAVIEAAEDYAKLNKMGRMPTPLVGVLDEAANVCRWKALPDQYSHYGSRGIILMTILQSWAQGVECWGERGMEKLWSAANIRVYGGGVSDAQFLERLSNTVGEYDVNARSTSYGDGKRSTSTQIQRHKVIEVSELAAMEPGRAIVFSSGHPVTMVRTIPWMQREDAEAVKKSFRMFDAAGNAHPWARPNADRRQPVPAGPPEPVWVKDARNASRNGTPHG